MPAVILQVEKENANLHPWRSHVLPSQRARSVSSAPRQEPVPTADSKVITLDDKDVQGVGKVTMQFLLADHENGLALNLVQHGMVESDPQKGQSCEEKTVDMHYFRDNLKFERAPDVRLVEARVVDSGCVDVELGGAPVSVSQEAKQFFDDHGFMAFANPGQSKGAGEKSPHSSFLESYLGHEGHDDDLQILRTWFAEINARASAGFEYRGIGDQSIKTALGKLSVGILQHWKNEVFDVDVLGKLAGGKAFFAPTQGT
eukprot:COSAG01_NODE_3809_length_5675_cov_5.163349_3_plen_258_part_00